MDDDDLENLERGLEELEQRYAGERAMELDVAKMLLALGVGVALPNESLSTAVRRSRAESVASADVALRAAETALTPATFKTARDSLVVVIAYQKRLQRDQETAVARGDDDTAMRLVVELQQHERTRDELMARLRELSHRL